MTLMTRTVEAWFAEADAAEENGDLLRACDVLEQAVGEHPSDVGLRRRAVLVLVRAGAARHARRRFLDFALDGEDDAATAALSARIDRALALAETGDERRRLAARAAERYDALYVSTTDPADLATAGTLLLVA
ncbi:MAG: hypothetical protein WBX17_04505, partial [Microbacterium sp.]